MEANTAALQVTPHTCDLPQNKYYPSCDKSGCGVNTYKLSPSAYGPSASYSIDTTKPFTVSTEFGTTGGQLTSVTTTLSQLGGKNVVMSHTDSNCGSGYLQKLTDAISTGMVSAETVSLL